MTVVGKILVFMNLLLSVATSAMIVLVFTTRSNWKNEYEKARNVALVAEAAYKTEKIAHESDVKSRESQLDSLGKVNRSLVTENEAIVAEKKTLETARDALQAQQVQQEANLKILNTEVDKQKAERAGLIAETEKQRARVLEIQKELNDTKLLATNNRIEADSQTQRARRLLDRVEELEKNLTQATNKLNSLGSGLASSNRSLLSPDAPPAPRDVHGTVRAVATSGLTVINIGSDSGLTAGNKLLISRIDTQNPKNSLYLGELLISRTEPKQAVGQFYPKPFAKADERLPKENDIVSTSLGNR